MNSAFIACLRRVESKSTADRGNQDVVDQFLSERLSCRCKGQVPRRITTMRLVGSLRLISPQLPTHPSLLLRNTPSFCPFGPAPWRRRSSTTTSSIKKLPPQIPAAGCVNLTPLRGLLALHGPDSAKFLQGLVTKIFPSETEPNGMFTSFLSPQVKNLKFPD